MSSLDVVNVLIDIDVEVIDVGINVLILTLQAASNCDIGACSDQHCNDYQCSDYLVDHQQCGNTSYFIQDGLNLGCENIGVHRGVLVDTGIEPR